MPPKGKEKAATSEPTASQAQASCDCCGCPLKSYDATRPRRCTTCDKYFSDWLEATSWGDLINFNREHIDGVRPVTIYATTSTFVDCALNVSLHRLHDYGLLVTFAQPEHSESGQELSGKWMGQHYQIKDRAHITFVLPTNHPKIEKEKVNELIAQLFTMKEIEFVSYNEHYDYDKGVGLEGWYTAFPVGTGEGLEVEPYKRFYSTVGSKTGRTTQKYRAASIKEDVMWKKWKRCHQNELTVITEKDLPPGSKGRRAFGEQIPMSLGMQPVIITVATRNWPPTEISLAQKLEVAVIAAGLKPIFSEESKKEENMKALEDLMHSLKLDRPKPTESEKTKQDSKLPEEPSNGNRTEGEEAESKQEKDLENSFGA